MRNISLQVKKINFFYLALIVFVCSLPLSEFMVSVSAGLLILAGWIEDSWQNKSERIKSRKLILFIPAIFIIYLISALIFRKGETALYDLRKSLFFLILPLAFLSGKEITSRQKQNIIFFFILSVFVAAIYAFLNWKIVNRHHYLNIRNASLITHIRFSFQLILAIWFILFLIYKNPVLLSSKWLPVFVSTAIVITGFLFLQQSLTGIVAFISSVIFVLFIVSVKTEGKKKFALLIFIVLIIILPVLYVARIAYPFYHPEKIDRNSLPETTARGNPYHYDFDNKLIENGKYVYLYVCEKEMREEWNKRSALKYDSLDQYGYSIKSTLVRYLTSKGLTKDAAGVNALTDQDISNIQNGISNYLFEKKKWSLFPRIYKSVWQFYVYTKLGYVNNQSLSQRIEFSKAAISIIRSHFWFGVGAGNWKEAFYNAYKKMNSRLSENYYASSHNQYLNYLVKFGITGFLFIMFFLIYPVIISKRYLDPLFAIFIVFMFVANFADSNFESHMGSSFFVFFYCFFLVTDGTDYLDLKILSG